MEDGEPSQQMMLEQLDIHWQKHEIRLKDHTLYKNELKMEHELTCKTVQLLEKKTWEESLGSRAR